MEDLSFLASALPDIIFAVKGNIYPMVNDEVYQYMVIKNGRIEKLLKEGDEITITKPDSFEIPVVNYQNYFIFPGFIDNHVHLIEVGLHLIFPNLENISTLDELFDILTAECHKFHSIGVMFAFNFEPHRVKENRYPTRKELDKICSELPIVVFRRDIHSAVVNTKALEQVFSNNIDVDGIELDENNQPTGLLRRKALALLSEHYYRSRITTDIRIQAFYSAVSLGVKKGLTTIVALTDDEDTPILLNLLSRLPAEVVIFYQTTNIQKVKEFGLTRIGGCILIDGSFSSHTAALKEEYADKKGEKGVLYFSDDELLSFLKSADKEGLQIAVHAVGDRAIEQVVSCYERFLAPESNNPLRHRIEHCELISASLLTRLKKLNLYISVQPTFEYLWGGEGKMYHSRLGERIKYTNPFRTFVNTGLTILGGSDAPVTSLDPLLGIKSAITHPNENERLDNKSAILMYTQWGAKGIFKENEIGMLKEGYWADFVVLKSNPLFSVCDESDIVAVYKQGCIRYLKGAEVSLNSVKHLLK